MSSSPPPGPLDSPETPNETSNLRETGAAEPAAVPVFLLAGGLGTRLRGVESLPKALIPIHGVPFLVLLVHQLRRFGFREVHFLLGHGAELVRQVFSPGPSRTRADSIGEGYYAPWLAGWTVEARRSMNWHFHEEPSPLGTGGALGAARDAARSMNLVVNGDSYLESDLRDLLEAAARPPASAALAAVWMDDRSDYGGLELDADDRVTRFLEKGTSSDGWINGGVYAVAGAVLRGLPEGPSSLEREVLPRLAAEGSLVARPRRCYFRDIGTPQRLSKAREELGPRVERIRKGVE